MQPEGSLGGETLNGREAIILSKSGTAAADFRPESALAVPILNSTDALGALMLVSTEPGLFAERDIGRVQLLAALIAFAQLRRRTGPMQGCSQAGPRP